MSDAALRNRLFELREWFRRRGDIGETHGDAGYVAGAIHYVGQDRCDL